MRALQKTSTSLEVSRNAWKQHYDKAKERLSPSEQRVAVARIEKQAPANQEQTRVKIERLNHKAVVAMLGSRIKDLAFIAGITKVEQHEAQIVISQIIAYERELTIDEIILAFELFAGGETDQYLPKVNGEANRFHRNTLTPEFTRRVLKAYKGLKNELWAKIYRIGEKSSQ